MGLTPDWGLVVGLGFEALPGSLPFCAIGIPSGPLLRPGFGLKTVRFEPVGFEPVAATVFVLKTPRFRAP